MSDRFERRTARVEAILISAIVALLVLAFVVSFVAGGS